LSEVAELQAKQGKLGLAAIRFPPKLSRRFNAPRTTGRISSYLWTLAWDLSCTERMAWLGSTSLQAVQLRDQVVKIARMLS